MGLRARELAAPGLAARVAVRIIDRRIRAVVAGFADEVGADETGRVGGLVGGTGMQPEREEEVSQSAVSVQVRLEVSNW